MLAATAPRLLVFAIHNAAALLLIVLLVLLSLAAGFLLGAEGADRRTTALW